MIAAGCDPLYIVRRLLAIASEDIGNADLVLCRLRCLLGIALHALALQKVNALIAQAVVYLACAPKSNAWFIQLGSKP
ncbi:hypothetical protein OH492_19630 [Vibrio chagasii]|nr:hypothetical protein [Vibrio chagasii]